jgi:hybrid cluster-associated redox disulfide protein
VAGRFFIAREKRREIREENSISCKNFSPGSIPWILPLEIWGKMGYTIPILKTNWRYYFMAQITKDTIIGNILDIAPETAPLFISIGMHCLGCPSSRGETVEQACMVHGVDVDVLLAKLNSMISAAK